MADNFQVVSQRRTVQILSATEVIDVEEVGFVTKPSGVYAQREVPIAAWASEGAGAWIEPLAAAIEGLISGGLASGATFVQSVDDTGLLTNAIAFVVTYTPPSGIPGPMQTTVEIPVNALTLDTSFGTFTGTSPADRLDAAFQALVYTANL